MTEHNLKTSLLDGTVKQQKKSYMWLLHTYRLYSQLRTHLLCPTECARAVTKIIIEHNKKLSEIHESTQL